VKIKSLEKVLCVVLLSIFAAHDVSRAEEPVSEESSAQTLFGYNSSFRARLHDSLVGNSVMPPDVPVELTPVDPSALAHATINSTVTFRVVRTVVVGQYAYAYGGTLIEAKVNRIREGKLQIRHGIMEPRVMEITVAGLLGTSPPPAPDSLKLRLESSPRSRSSRTATQLITLPLTLPLKATHIVVLVPEYALLWIVCSTQGCDL
jgi:hypothetical protein